MLKELKQKEEQKKWELRQSFQWRKENFKRKYIERFPKPNLEKPEAHLLEENQAEITAQSTKTTRLILKFWLIWLGVVALGYMMFISLDYIYMVLAAFIISLALEWCIIFWQRITKSRWIWIFNYPFCIVWIYNINPFIFQSMNWVITIINVLTTKITVSIISIVSAMIYWGIITNARFPKGRTNTMASKFKFW